jgi:carbon-monoxide dehydrogenase small subunit
LYQTFPNKIKMKEHDISLTVNGNEHKISVESSRLLVHVLRDDLGYTGPNVGCESSKCGACTVHVDGRAITSCTTLAVQADGSNIDTIEGVSSDDGELHPIQQSFHEEHGLQCGYCTPGMIMTSLDLLDRNPDPDDDEIRNALKGNICRCTGYQNIINSVESASKKMTQTSEDEGMEGV